MGDADGPTLGVLFAEKPMHIFGFKSVVFSRAVDPDLQGYSAKPACAISNPNPVGSVFLGLRIIFHTACVDASVVPGFLVLRDRMHPLSRVALALPIAQDTHHTRMENS